LVVTWTPGAAGGQKLDLLSMKRINNSQ
jgi:hypothetical protein